MAKAMPSRSRSKPGQEGRPETPQSGGRKSRTAPLLPHAFTLPQERNHDEGRDFQSCRKRGVITGGHGLSGAARNHDGRARLSVVPQSRPYAV